MRRGVNYFFEPLAPAFGLRDMGSGFVRLRGFVVGSGFAVGRGLVLFTVELLDWVDCVGEGAAAVGRDFRLGLCVVSTVFLRCLAVSGRLARASAPSGVKAGIRWVVMAPS